jgi:hypothetical protein
MMKNQKNSARVSREENNDMVISHNQDVQSALDKYRQLRENMSTGKGLVAKMLHLMYKALLRKPYAKDTAALLGKQRHNVEKNKAKLETELHNLDSIIADKVVYLDKTINELAADLALYQKASDQKEKFDSDYHTITGVIKRPDKYSAEDFLNAAKAFGKFCQEYNQNNRDYQTAGNRISVQKGVISGTIKVIENLEVMAIVETRYLDTLGYMVSFIGEMEKPMAAIEIIAKTQLETHNEYLVLQTSYKELKHGIVDLARAHNVSTAKLTNLDLRELEHD